MDERPMVLLFRILAVSLLLSMAVLALFQYSSGSWPTVEGQVESGITTNRDQRLSGRSNKVLYRYEVNGTTYTGTQMGFHDGTNAISIKGVREQRQPRAGDAVTVYYLPFYPGFALLVPGAPPTLLWWSLIAVLMSILLWAVSHVMKEPVF
jgi:hypothetical protein